VIWSGTSAYVMIVSTEFLFSLLNNYTLAEGSQPGWLNGQLALKPAFLKGCRQPWRKPGDRAVSYPAPGLSALLSSIQPCEKL